MDIKTKAIKGTTQEHLSIEDITHDMVILKNGHCAYILETSSVNFDLLSEREQEAMIYAYASLLNSLTFPIQIFIHSALKDVSNYLKYLHQWEMKTNQPLIKKQIAHYRQFITQVVEKNQVLTKSFYLVVPFSPLEMGVAAAKTVFSFRSLFRKNLPSQLPLPKPQLIARAKANLDPKRDHLIHALARLGLRAHQLKTPQLISLFYSIYNQEKLEVKNSPLKENETPVVLAKVNQNKAQQKENG